MKEVTKNTLRMPAYWAAGMLILLIIQESFDIFLGNEIIESPRFYCAFLWSMFAILSAKFEAHFYNYASKDNAKKPNLHPLLWFTRLMVVIPMWALTDWKTVLCFLFAFPFFHDGAYYAQRNRITPSKYPKKWLDQSTTSTAKIDKFLLKLFSPKVIVIWRIVLAIASLTVLILLNYGQNNS